MKTVSIIGVGRVGGALALALDEKCRIENLIVRNPENASAIAGHLINKPSITTIFEAGKITSEIILICTQDSQIGRVSAELAGNLKHKPFVFHMSGALSSEALNDLRNIGCPTGSIHPLISISDPFLGFSKFKDAYFCVEGEASAVSEAEKIVKHLRGKSFSVETRNKTLYHAAAVTACGHLVAIIDTALEMLGKCGLEEPEARRILLPLIKSTIENLETQTTVKALTGPFARADLETFEKHLEKLKESVDPTVVGLYLELGERSLQLAEKQGANREKLDALRQKISLAKKNLK
jgi:predicted short-subunit dehydrogenase-like oxidoreductase (DUF2520 family)